MKTLFRFSLIPLAGLMLASTALAGSPVKRALVRDANGKARVVYVRASDNRIMYPQVIRQVPRAGGGVKYLPAVSSAYRPGGYGYQGGLGGYYGLPGRRYYPTGTGYPSYYRPSGNYGVDSILYQGNRGKYGIPGYGLPGGAFPRPVVKPQLPGLPLPRYSGSAKGR